MTANSCRMTILIFCLLFCMKEYLNEIDGNELFIDLFNLSKEWQEKIMRLGNEYLSCVRNLVDVNPSEEEEEEDTFGDALLFAESMSLKKKYKYPITKMRGSYRKYTPEQIERLFDSAIKENYTAKDTALLTGINVRTAQNYVKHITMM